MSMYLPIPPQPDCASAWREAVRAVDIHSSKHAANNVIIDVANPALNASLRDPRVSVVNDFLQERDKSVETVANTIFPESLYLRHGAPKFFEIFNDRVLAKVRRTDRWSGYYFERMTNVPGSNGKPFNQLWNIVERMNDTKVKALNKFEITIFDPARDVDDSPYGGQCLSFGSFKLLAGTTKTLTLTVMYRNHFYIEKLLGNLIGLGRLMAFVAKEANVNVGALTVISAHAQIDTPGCKRGDIAALLNRFDHAETALEPA
jgi:thymidylate synthase